MRIGVDMISAGGGFAPAAGGMTTYYEGLAAALPGIQGVDEVIAFMPPGAEHARITPGDKLGIVRCERVPASRPGRVVYEHLRFPGLVRAEGADVLLSTHNVRPLRWRGPSVVVLQSIQFFLLPEPIGAARRAYLRAAIPRSLRTADRVIAVSETSRRDAIGLFDLDPERIVAVHHGPSRWAIEAAERFARDGTPPPPAPLDHGRPYILNVSSLYGFKNHRRLIEAFARAVAAEDAPHELAIAGRDADVTAKELGDLAATLGVGERVRLLGPFPQEHLPALIANAHAVAYPSLYETFGHPVLEAFALGRPVLTANVGGAAEVAADAAVTVDPADVESIAGGLARLLAEGELRDRLGEAGARRLGDFSWERCAEGTTRALADAIRSID